MYRTFEAIYKEGHVVPLEEIDAEEQSKLLIVVLEQGSKASKTHSWESLKGKYKKSLSTVNQFTLRKQAEKRLEL